MEFFDYFNLTKPCDACGQIVDGGVHYCPKCRWSAFLFGKKVMVLVSKKKKRKVILVLLYYGRFLISRIAIKAPTTMIATNKPVIAGTKYRSATDC